MSTRRQVEAEAAERWPGRPDQENPLCMMKRTAFVAGRTVSTEQWGAASVAIRDKWNLCGDDAGCQCEDANELAWEVTKDTFRAAGLLIEGDDDQ